jgi:hypothetical protein
MKQGSLFQTADLVPLPAPSLGEAEAARDEAMAVVEIKAEGNEPGFSDRAAAFVLLYLADGPRSGEDITDACVVAGIVPENLKAFGPVYMKLARSGKIVKCGMCARKRGHGSAGANIWGLAH